ncbi:Ribosome-binding factor A [hydrothermal vent metagenome]|uniref:Ribosome-binding factor A n=1 Tax=hydrothermal vent metagenome TaxID=652676 RepID=A0A3B0RJB7_9ZZZZ
MGRKKSNNRPPSQRQLRAGELVRHALVDILAREELRDTDLDGVSVTISEVRCAPDLRHAQVYCAPLGGGDSETMVRALNRCGKFLGGRLAGEMTMKFTPRLHFVADVSFETASALDELLNRPEVARDLNRSPEE